MFPAGARRRLFPAAGPIRGFSRSEPPFVTELTETFNHLRVSTSNETLNGFCVRRRTFTRVSGNTLLQRELSNPIWQLKDEREHTAAKLSVFEFT